MLTRWGETLDKQQVLQEYPRPQLVREDWMCLNGECDYEITPAGEPCPKNFSGKIILPFAIESQLSGVQRVLQPDERLWYRKRFTLDSRFDGKRCILHFGAVDWQCKVFVNGDDDLLSTLKSTPEKQIVRFGLGENCDWRAVELEADTEGTRFICVHDGKRVEMYVPAAGEHNVRNALAAVAVAVEVGVPEEKAVAAIRTYAPPAMRQQIKEVHGVTLIDDTYNASPDSMRAALKILGGLKAAGKKYAVLADMLELGDYAERGHYETGAFAAENGTDVLIGVGPLAKHIVEGFKNRENSAWFASNAEAIAYLKDRLHPGDAVLCKGSRGMHMDEIIHALSE